MNMGSFLQGGLRNKLIIISILFALLTLGQVAVNIKLISEMQGTASSAQLYGKGRYLGASLLRVINMIDPNESEINRQEYSIALRDIVSQMDDRYAVLRHGRPATGIKPAQDPQLLTMLDESETLWRNVIQPQIETVLNASPSRLEREKQVLLNALAQLIDRVEDSVTVYEQLSASHQQQSVLLQWFFLLAYLVIFALVLFILRGIFIRLSQTADRLSGFASQLLAGSSQQVAASQEQAAAVSQTNSTAEELDQTASQTVELSKSVMDISRRVTEVGESGAQRVEEAIQAMAHVQEQSERIAGNILSLADKTRSVSKIISVVGDIAEQTNILAINAGIEASREQMAGSGFTAVAREIKELASQSRQATAEVRHILGEVQQATGAAVMLMEEGSKRVEQAIVTVNSSQQVIDELLQAVRENARSATKISASTNQQAIGTSQIRQAMNDISNATGQSVSAIKQVQATAAKLNELNGQLKNMLNG